MPKFMITARLKYRAHIEIEAPTEEDAENIALDTDFDGWVPEVDGPLVDIIRITAPCCGGMVVPCPLHARQETSNGG